MNRAAQDITRRSFLSSSAAALAGVATLNAGASTLRPMRNGASLRIAVAGCGARGMLLLAGLRALAADGLAVRVTAVADEDPAQRKAAAVLADAASHADWRAVAARSDVDALVVALPDDLHVPAALAALQCGKHVYLETPVAHSRAEAQRLAQAAQAVGSVVEIGAAECALPAWRVAAELVRDGRIGRVHWCHSVAACSVRGGAADWRGQRDRSQGLAAQLHYDQLMPLLLVLAPGPATAATTAGGRWDGLGNTPDSLISTVRFGDALSINLVSSALNTAGQRPMLRGELGSIEVCVNGVLLTPEQGAEQWIPAPAGPFTAEQLLLRDWAEAARGAHAPLCPLFLGLAAQEAVDLSVSAYGNGRMSLQA